MNFASAVTVAFERVRLRGAPTILNRLSKIDSLREQIATVMLPGGQTISFPKYDGYWARYLYAGTIYEEEVNRFFHEFGKGRVLIDCGANIGYWSVRHTDFGFTNSIAIEPNPKLVRFLRMNYSGPIHEAAVYSVSGEILDFSGDGAMGHINCNTRTSDAKSLKVKSLALKDLGIRGKVVVKLDVEGAEIPAVEGLGDMDAILVYEDFPKEGMTTTRHLIDHGWRVFDLLDRRRGVFAKDARLIRDADEAASGLKWPRNFVAMR